MSEKSIILLTSNFPYPPGEEFLESEIPYLLESFSEVIFFPSNLVSGPRRDLPPGAYVPSEFLQHDRLSTNFVDVLYDGLGILLRHLLRVDRLEMLIAIRYGPKAVRRLLGFLVNAYRINFRLSTFLERTKKNAILYSYWLDEGAYAITQLKGRYPAYPVVARAHRHDIYSDLLDPPYLPYQREIIRNLDLVFPVSEHGRRYLSGHHTGFEEKLIVSRLGVPKAARLASYTEGPGINLVSCSYLKPVKRVSLLVESLHGINFPVHWTHLGDGPEVDRVKRLAKSLPSNVTYSLKGHLPHDAVLAFYRANPVDLFVNLSESEGVPVSIMEALSFGIPVMATAVGGTPELVLEKNGILLDANPRPETIRDKLLEFHLLTANARVQMRRLAYETWRDKVDADIQYPAFVKNLSSL